LETRRHGYTQVAELHTDKLGCYSAGIRSELAFTDIGLPDEFLGMHPKALFSASAIFDDEGAACLPAAEVSMQPSLEAERLPPLPSGPAVYAPAQNQELGNPLPLTAVGEGDATPTPGPALERALSPQKVVISTMDKLWFHGKGRARALRPAATLPTCPTPSELRRPRAVRGVAAAMRRFRKFLCS
jgi:hypothetical protein